MAPGPISILLVEDEPLTRQVTARYLAQAGFQVEVAETGEEALEFLRGDGHCVDWLLTDINLPGAINGWVVGAEYHLNHPLRPVLYVSAFASPSSPQPADGVYISKPYSPAMIVDTIRNLAAEGERDDHRPFSVRLEEFLRSRVLAT